MKFTGPSGTTYGAEDKGKIEAHIKESIGWQQMVARQSPDPAQRKRASEAAAKLEVDLAALTAVPVDYVREKFVDRTADTHPLECMACNRRFADARALHQHLGASNRQHRKTHAWKMKGAADAGKDHIPEP